MVSSGGFPGGLTLGAVDEWGFTLDFGHAVVAGPASRPGGLTGVVADWLGTTTGTSTFVEAEADGTGGGADTLGITVPVPEGTALMCPMPYARTTASAMPAAPR